MYLYICIYIHIIWYKTWDSQLDILWYFWVDRIYGYTDIRTQVIRIANLISTWCINLGLSENGACPMSIFTDVPWSWIDSGKYGVQSDGTRMEFLDPFPWNNWCIHRTWVEQRYLVLSTRFIWRFPKIGDLSMALKGATVSHGLIMV